MYDGIILNAIAFICVKKRCSRNLCERQSAIILIQKRMPKDSLEYGVAKRNLIQRLILRYRISRAGTSV